MAISIIILFIIFVFILPIILLIYWSYKQKRYYEKYPEEAKKVNLKYKRFYHKYSQLKQLPIVRVLWYGVLIMLMYKLFSPINLDDYTLSTNILKPWTTFVADINHDGKITITDVEGWVEWLFLFPGNCFIFMILFLFPKLSIFLEISTSSYNTPMAGIIAVLFWILLYFFVITAAMEIQKKR